MDVGAVGGIGEVGRSGCAVWCGLVRDACECTAGNDVCEFEEGRGSLETLGGGLNGCRGCGTGVVLDAAIGIVAVLQRGGLEEAVSHLV